MATLTSGRSVGVWQAYGSIFFGSISKLEAITATSQPLPDIVVLDLHRVITMDTPGLQCPIFFQSCMASVRLSFPVFWSKWARKNMVRVSPPR